MPTHLEVIGVTAQVLLTEYNTLTTYQLFMCFLWTQHQTENGHKKNVNKQTNEKQSPSGTMIYLTIK